MGIIYIDWKKQMKQGNNNIDIDKEIQKESEI